MCSTHKIRIATATYVNPLLYNHTSSQEGPTSTNGVALENGTFRFLEHNYTTVTVSLPSCVTLIHYISSQVSRETRVTLSPDPLVRLFPFEAELSRRGLVLYLETQDQQLISRSSGEVNTAFPGLAFTPVFLFIATWLQLSTRSPQESGVSYNTMISRREEC